MATFISYSRANSDFAVRLASDLKSAGFDVWLDQLDIPTGARWDDEIEKALEKSNIFLIILSPESIESQNVKDEVGYAIDSGKYILPVLTMPCKVPLRLRRFQFVDFSNQPYEESLAETKQLLSSSRKPAATDVTHVGAEKLGIPPARREAAPQTKNTSQAGRAPMKKPGAPKSNRTWLLALVVAGICGVAVIGLAALMFLSSSPQSFVRPPSSTPPTIVTTAAPTDTDAPEPIAMIITGTPSATATTTETPTATTQPDLCARVASQSLKLNIASGFQGVIGPAGLVLLPKGNASYEFTTVAAFPKEQLDTVSGVCEKNILKFTRTRPQAFIQDYQMTISESSNSVLALDGSLTDRSTSKKVLLSGQVTAPVTPMGLCDQLAGKSINIKHANGFQGVIGPDGIALIANGDGTYSFSTVAAYVNEPTDPVAGRCQANTLTFTRTRTNAFIQDFQAAISQNGGVLSLTGSMTNSQTGRQGNWSGQVIDPHP